ncbi:MAG: hypothetical protein ACYCX4_01660 [Bacillota bacterium]
MKDPSAKTREQLRNTLLELEALDRKSGATGENIVAKAKEMYKEILKKLQDIRKEIQAVGVGTEPDLEDVYTALLVQKRQLEEIIADGGRI